jgi:hypothetical protein
MKGGIAKCKLPNGRTGRGLVMVVFSPDDGTVVKTAVQPPFSTKKPDGQCVDALVKTARMAPFKPPALPIIYQFDIPR